MGSFKETHRILLKSYATSSSRSITLVKVIGCLTANLLQLQTVVILLNLTFGVNLAIKWQNKCSREGYRWR